MDMLFSTVFDDMVLFLNWELIVNLIIPLLGKLL